MSRRGAASAAMMHSAALGNLARSEGRYEEGRAILVDALMKNIQVDRGRATAALVAMFGMLEVARGKLARGVRLISASAQGDAPIGTVHLPDVRYEAPIYLERARAQLGDHAYDGARSAGRAMSLDQAVRYALSEEE